MFKDDIGKFIGERVLEKSSEKTDGDDTRKIQETADRVDKYRQFADLGRDLHAQYEAFMAAGFTETQAFKMILTLLSNAVFGAMK